LALLRGDYEGADEHLRAALAAFGAYGRNTGTWYSWSLRTIAARLAIRRGDATGAVAIADELIRSPSTPPSEVLEAQLIGIEALLTADRVDEALARLRHAGQHLDPAAAPTRAAEFQRLMGLAQLHRGFPDVAERHLRASVAGFDQTGDRYQAAMSRWALARACRARGSAEDAKALLGEAEVTLEALGAVRDLDAVRADALLAPAVARQTTPLPLQ